MTVSDPIADMLTRIRNAQMVQYPEIEVPSSMVKKAIVDVLKREGYIEDYQLVGEPQKLNLKIQLKYFKGKPVISSIKRVSRPRLRVYKANHELPKVLGGLGIAVISTSKGVLSDKEARHLGVGGEVLCYVE
ncbi:MAG: 30S ribosomal protein S8 [Gammaproteobacteria bacterium]|nr:30S ribosomal protein S8 [Gammaproteobacteria bacterium]